MMHGQKNIKINEVVCEGVEWVFLCSRYGLPVGCCEGSYQSSCSIKSTEFLDWLSNYLNLKTEPAPWNKL